MTRLVDTSIRVLSQEPLAGAIPTATLLELAELLDGAGFAYLEVSGGGVFDSAVRQGVESPWERIRSLKARTTTPLALAVRGRFLVGSRPVGDDLIRRFMSSAAASGIDVFRLHDPLNDVDNLRVAAEAIVDAGCEFDAGLQYGSSRHEALLEAAGRLPGIGAARILLHDPAGLLQPHRAGELVAELRELTEPPRRPLRSGGGAQRARAGARGHPGGRRPDRLRRLPGGTRDASDLGGVAHPGARRHRARSGRRHRHAVAGGRPGRRPHRRSARSRRSCRGSPSAPRAARSRSGSWPRSTTSCASAGRATGWRRC